MSVDKLQPMISYQIQLQTMSDYRPTDYRRQIFRPQNNLKIFGKIVAELEFVPATLLKTPEVRPR